MQLYDTVTVCVGSDVVGIAHIMKKESCVIVPLWPFAQAQSLDNFIPCSGDPMPRMTIDYDFPLIGGGRTLRRFYQTPWGTWEGGIVKHPRRPGSGRYDSEQVAYILPFKKGDQEVAKQYQARREHDRALAEDMVVNSQIALFQWVRKHPSISLIGLPAWKVRMILKIVEL